MELFQRENSKRAASCCRRARVIRDRQSCERSRAHDRRAATDRDTVGNCTPKSSMSRDDTLIASGRSGCPLSAAGKMADDGNRPAFCNCGNASPARAQFISGRVERYASRNTFSRRKNECEFIDRFIARYYCAAHSSVPRRAGVRNDGKSAGCYASNQFLNGGEAAAPGISVNCGPGRSRDVLAT